jgi:hypothetical protein
MITLVVSIVLTLIFVRVIYLIVLRFVSLRKTVPVFFTFSSFIDGSLVLYLLNCFSFELLRSLSS